MCIIVYTEFPAIFFLSLGHEESSLRTTVLGEHQQRPLGDPELQEPKPLFYSSITANPLGDIHDLIHPQVLNSQEFLYQYILCDLILLRTTNYRFLSFSGQNIKLYHNFCAFSILHILPKALCY